VEDRIIPGGTGLAKKNKPSNTTERGFIPSSIIKRPALGRPGPKRGLGFTAPRILPTSNVKTEGETEGETAKPAAKSNADFKELFLRGSNPKNNNGKVD